MKMFINFFGVVTETFQNNTAEVVIGKPSGKGNMLTEAQKSNKMRVIAKNPVYAREGDLVSLTLNRVVTKEEVFYTYLLPTLLFFVIFFAVHYGVPELQKTNIPFLVGLIGLLIGLGAYAVKRKNFSKTYKGNIKRIRTLKELKKYDKYNF